MINISEIEYLILHEDEVDWDALSNDPEQLNSIVEVRLFRKRINWRKYIISHRDIIYPEILSIGSKHFTEADYSLVAIFGIADEKFIREHLEKFNFKDIIHNCDLSADFLLEYQDKWKNIDGIKDAFQNSKINLDAKDMTEVKLILETL